jgi:hypothetical protein
MENKIRAYSLEEISKWQNEENSCIQLPSMQRGFVWRPHQIENLWDSILRGYPIGAILMSVDEEKRFLLDGQQRCTSIALGFFDPFKNGNITQYFSLKDYLPSLWIDLKPNIKNENKFLIRVLTKSHPWGYQIQREKNGTGKPLSMANRKKAYEYFKSKENTNYINLKPSCINPWDANFPVPLSYLLSIDVSTLDCFVNELKTRLKKLKIKTINSGVKEVDFESITNDDLSAIFKGIIKAKKLLLPEIEVDATLLKDDDDNQLSDASQDPTLFVRLNSAGTNISGEELIYSVYKAAFPDVKDGVEKIGASFIAPSKVINLISRLAYCEIKQYKSLPANFTVNSFRKEIKNSDFKNRLYEYIKGDEAKNLIETAKLILNQNEIRFDEFSIPPILLKQFIVSSPDLFLVLLIFIKQNELHKKTLGINQIKEISASYVQLLWFSCENAKTPSLLYSQLIIAKKGWKESVNEMVNNNQVVPLVKPQLLRDNLIKIVVDKKLAFGDFEIIKKDDLLSNEIKLELLICKIDKSLDDEPNKSDEERVKINEEKNRVSDELLKSRWWMHVSQIFSNKSLLIFAQRKYFFDKFQDFNQLENIEDTNRPWDWDHIYPNSWVYKKEGVNPLVRHWVNSIGNFRALSYDDNRSENNHLSPAVRLKKEEKKVESFILLNDYEFWEKLGDQSWRIKDNDETLTNFLSAVIHRMVNIYEDWYKNYYKKN